MYYTYTKLLVNGNRSAYSIPIQKSTNDPKMWMKIRKTWGQTRLRYIGPFCVWVSPRTQVKASLLLLSQSTFSSSKPLTSILRARFLLPSLRRTRRPHKTKPNKSRHRHILPDHSASKSRRPFCGSFWVSVHSTPFSHIRSTPSKGLVLLFRAFRGRNAINGTAKSRFSAGGTPGDGGFVGFTCKVEGLGISGLFWTFLGGFPGVENRRSFFPPPSQSE